MHHAASGLKVLLTEFVDGIGTIQDIQVLIVVVQQGGVEIQEIIVDLLRHCLMLLVERETLAMKQLLAIFRQVSLCAVYGNAIRNVGHT